MRPLTIRTEHRLHPWLAAIASSIVAAAGLLIALPAASLTPPLSYEGACTRVILGIPVYLDPCIPEGEPLPDDVLPWVEEIRRVADCTGAEIQPPGVADPAQAQAATAFPTWTSLPTAFPTSAPPTWAPTSAPPTATPTSVPPSESPSASPSTSPSPCPSLTPTAPPSSPPPSTPPPTTLSPSSPPPSSPTPAPSLEPCPAPVSAQQDQPRDREEDRVCQRPEDTSKDAVLVATGDSVTSAYHQTKSAASTNCAVNNSAKDHRNLPGNDMMFSYAGRYYKNLNKNISEYYNFARVGFNTDDIIKAPAAKTDTCANPWNRVKPPLGLADDAVKAAKLTGKKAYFVTTGGVNNTNWTDMLIQFAQCRGLEVLTDAFKATAFSTNATKFEWWAVGQLPGAWDKIIDNGGGCRATWWVPRPWPFPPLLLNPIRIGVPAYDGPGGAAPSPLAKQIAGDAKTIVTTMLNSGADKVVWMLYYSIIPAEVDLAAVVSEILGGYAGIKYLKDVVPWIFALGDASLVPVQLVGRIRLLERDLNNEIKSQLPVNAKLVVQPAPALGAGDIQKTVPMGCPHPNDKGHDKLANALKTAIG